MKKVIKFKEQGFCFGVSRSIEITQKAIDNPNTKKPIYLLGHLVHNHYVNDHFSNMGVIVLNSKTRYEMLDQVNSGTIIITAHGVSTKVLDKARKKGLDIVDATCPYVTKTVEKIKEKANNGYHILYIGKINHPEVETIQDEIKDSIIIEQNKKLPKIPKGKCVLAHQTTLSDYDVKSISEVLCKKYKNIELLEQVCIFPEKRQQEINNYDFSKERNLVIVVGDKISNNATKLVELVERKKIGDVMMFTDSSSVNNINFNKYDYIYITSGTSTPITIVDEIYNKIKEKENEKNIK